MPNPSDDKVIHESMIKSVISKKYKMNMPNASVDEVDCAVKIIFKNIKDKPIITFDLIQKITEDKLRKYKYMSEVIFV